MNLWQIWLDFYERKYKKLPIYVKSNQVVDFGEQGRFNAEIVFGNPLNLLEILKMQIAQWRVGRPSRVHLTGMPASKKIFEYQYRQLKLDLGIVTVRRVCSNCEGTGFIQHQVDIKRHWSGVKLFAFPGFHLLNSQWCPKCGGYGYREWMSEKALRKKL